MEKMYNCNDKDVHPKDPDDFLLNPKPTFKEFIVEEENYRKRRLKEKQERAFREASKGL